MIIEERTGNIFTSGCQTITVTTNCVGVMGKGIALEAKQRFPEVVEPYQRACKSGDHAIGKPVMYQTGHDNWLLLFPTKQHWRNASELGWIEEGLKALRRDALLYPFNQIRQLAMAPLGCGNGGLDYIRDVRPLIYRYLDPWPVEVILYKS